jgi:hypothetical protein
VYSPTRTFNNSTKKRMYFKLVLQWNFQKWSKRSLKNVFYILDLKEDIEKTKNEIEILKVKLNFASSLMNASLVYSSLYQKKKSKFSFNQILILFDCDNRTAAIDWWYRWNSWRISFW